MSIKNRYVIENCTLT